MEQQDAKETGAVTRGQNVLDVMPHDWPSIAYFLGPLLERVDAGLREVQLLVVTPDAETAADVAAAAVRLVEDRGISVLAATAARRASRLLRLQPAQVVAGAPDELLQLVKSTTLKLTQVRAVALAWVDELVAAGAEGALETLFADVPKEAARTIVAAELAPAVEALVERYARRARRVTSTTPPEGDVGVPIEYVGTSAFTRAAVLRRLLDELDPGTAAVFTRDEESKRAAHDTLRALGYGADAPVRVARTGGGENDLVVLYDLPASRGELREAVGSQPRRVVALVQPRQLASLRALAAGGEVRPLALPEAALRARSREAALRAELRDVLAKEGYGRELLALEPLLDDYDGIEIAAAVLRLLERARTEAEARPAATGARAGGGGGGGGGAKLFVNVGARDNARPGDLMGAIVNETGTPREAVGRIDVRESFSLVEVPARAAEEIAGKLTGTTIRGRRVMAKVEEDRPGRDSRGPARGAGRGQSPRGPAREGAPRGDRPAGPRGDRPGGPRGDRPRGAGPRSERPRGERPRDDRSRGERSRSDGRSGGRPARRERE